MDLKWRPGEVEEEVVQGVVRVMAVDEDNEQDYDNAMQFEYTDKDDTYFSNWLERNPNVEEWEINGNAYNVKGKKTAVKKLRDLIASRYGQKQFSAFSGRYAQPFRGKIGIEWNYWVE